MRRSRSASGSRPSPNPMLPSTVSHGKTPRSWNTKMRRGSGPVTGSPSIATAPAVGTRNPPTMFKSVDFPQPDGPSMQTSSPSRTSRSMFSRTRVSFPSVRKVMRRPRIESFVRSGARSGTSFIPPPAPRFSSSRALRLDRRLIPPARGRQPFESPHREVEAEPDDADQNHPRDDEVVPVACVARVDDQEAEPRVDGDHLRGHHDEPGDAERQPKPHDQLGQDRGRQHLARELRGGEAEVPAG